MPTNNGTVLITNGNLLSMLSLGDWLIEYGHTLEGVLITTRLPSAKSNLRGIWRMFMRSGAAYTYFKLDTNRFLPARLALRGLPASVPDLIRLLCLPCPIVYVSNVNDPAVIEQVRDWAPDILLSFSATSRFCDELIDIPSRVALNVHYALLPGYAGLSPYYWYLQHAEPSAGVTMHVMTSDLDAGPIICQERFETAGITSVLGLLRHQMEVVSPILCRFYAGEIEERSGVAQDLSKRSYFHHPTRSQVHLFHQRGLVFVSREDTIKTRRRAAELRRRARETRRIPEQESPVLRRTGLTPADEQAAALSATWYAPPMPRIKGGWLVYSLDFVLATLQGRVQEVHRVERSTTWRIAGTVVRALMAAAQAVIMILAWIPILSSMLETMARSFTRNPFGFFLRSCYWKARLANLGVDTLIDQGVEIWGPANISLGSHCHIDTFVRLAAGERRHGQRGSIFIGDYVHVGPNVHISGRGGVAIGNLVGISAAAHLYSATNMVESPRDPGELISMSHMAPRDQQHIYEAPIVVEDHAFIGMMARIMPGVTIGRGAIVHANTEVTRSIPPFANYGGIPRGRQIGWRRPRRPSPKLTMPAAGETGSADAPAPGTRGKEGGDSGGTEAPSRT